MDKAQTILKVVNDPQATRLLDRTVQDTVITLKQVHERTVLKPTLSEAEKKKALHDTTIIGRK
jgi:hypothetical protein